MYHSLPDKKMPFADHMVTKSLPPAPTNNQTNSSKTSKLLFRHPVFQITDKSTDHFSKLLSLHPGLLKS